MYIEKLSLQNFRNIEKINIELNKGINIFYGENGQGKTNIVEGIYLLSNGTSFRTKQTNELINTKANEASLTCLVKAKRSKKLKVLLRETGKTYLENDNVVTKLSDYLSNMSAICFIPEDVYIFKDSPKERRRFMDKELSSLFPIYVKQLINFKEALEARNNLLKNPSVDNMLLEILDIKFAESSYDIYKRRKWLISKISEFATNIYNKICSSNKKIKIVYHTFLNEDEKEKYWDKCLKILKNQHQKDIEKGFTDYGVHKDDFKVYLDEKEINMYASQGQQRIIAIAMKLAALEISSKAVGENPILILDDAFSELDNKIKNKLYEYIEQIEQVFITCTNYKQVISINKRKTANVIHITNGTILEREVI